VPQSQTPGTLTIAAEFDSGPLAGTIRAARTIRVGP
jgi:hypothetical protein